jgi:hypothetical protein
VLPGGRGSVGGRSPRQPRAPWRSRVGRWASPRPPRFCSFPSTATSCGWSSRSGVSGLPWCCARARRPRRCASRTSTGPRLPGVVSGFVSYDGPLYWHLSLAADERLTLFRPRPARRRAVRAIVRVFGPVALLFFVADDHLHITVFGTRGEVGRLAQRLALALRPERRKGTRIARWRSRVGRWSVTSAAACSVAVAGRSVVDHLGSRVLRGGRAVGRWSDTSAAARSLAVAGRSVGGHQGSRVLPTWRTLVPRWDGSPADPRPSRRPRRSPAIAVLPPLRFESTSTVHPATRG